MRRDRVRRFAGKTLLEHCPDPGWAITEGFNLFVLDEDGVAANPVVAADGAVQQFRIANPADSPVGCWSAEESS